MVMKNITIIRKSYTTELLEYIDHIPGLTKTEIIRAAGDKKSERMKFIRLQDMQDAGLIEVKMGNGNSWNAMSIYLTPKGSKVLECLKKINEIMEE